jgi:predicted membrane protein
MTISLLVLFLCLGGLIGYVVTRDGNPAVKELCRLLFFAALLVLMFQLARVAVVGAGAS